MAKAAADYLAGRDVTVLKSSPLQRAVETAEPIAAVFGLETEIDDRLIEPWNYFEGMRFAVGDGALRKPRHWLALRNPFRPSWGEPYQDVAARVLGAAADAARAAAGHEAVCVSHQMPIWIARRSVEGRRLWHDPRRRECALGSVTSLSYAGEKVTGVHYAEPSGPTPGRVRRRLTAPILGPPSGQPVPSGTMGPVLLPVGDLPVSRLHRPALIGAAALAALLATGCSGGPIGADTPLNSGKSFVGSSYESTVFKVGSRPQAPAVSGDAVTGGRAQPRRLPRRRRRAELLGLVVRALPRRGPGARHAGQRDCSRRGCGSSVSTSVTSPTPPRPSCKTSGSATRAFPIPPTTSRWNSGPPTRRLPSPRRSSSTGAAGSRPASSAPVTYRTLRELLSPIIASTHDHGRPGHGGEVRRLGRRRPGRACHRGRDRRHR